MYYGHVDGIPLSFVRPHHDIQLTVGAWGGYTPGTVEATPDTVVQMHAHVPRRVSRPSV